MPVSAARAGPQGPAARDPDPPPRQRHLRRASTSPSSRDAAWSSPRCASTSRATTCARSTGTSPRAAAPVRQAVHGGARADRDPGGRRKRAPTRFGTRARSSASAPPRWRRCSASPPIRNNDRAGALLFADGVERYVPPRKGKTHVLRLRARHPDLRPPGARHGPRRRRSEFLTRVLHRRSVVFLLSDFLDEGYERPLAALAVRHDVIALVLEDRRDRELPDVGLIEVVEPESGARRWLDTSSAPRARGLRRGGRRRDSFAADRLRAGGDRRRASGHAGRLG